MRLMILALFSVFVGLAHPQLKAAEANTAADSATATDQAGQASTAQGETEQTDDQGDAQEDAQDAEDDRPSRFIPTEQISQDLGVSFPADI